MNTPLEQAQKCYKEWLEELNGHLSTAELSFEEFSGSARNGDMKQAGESLARSEKAIKTAKQMVEFGINQSG